MLLEIFFVIYNIHNFVPSITINEVTMIDQATIDRILDAAQIVDVVSEFVTLRRRGVNYTCRLPKGCANAFPVVRVAMRCTSLWSTSNFRIMKL